MKDMNTTPLASRWVIGIFGKRNVGKSSLLNALTGQEIAVTSPVPGTTTDPVHKAMELLPLGPVVLVDTAGLDDSEALGQKRIEKTYEVLRKCDLALVVVNSAAGISSLETKFVDRLKRENIPFLFVFNQCDRSLPPKDEIRLLAERMKAPVVPVSALSGFGIETLKQEIIACSLPFETEPPLLHDLIQEGETAVLVTPIDKSAPKGRLILPQQQTIRALLDSGAVAVVTKEDQLKQTLRNLHQPPAIVITDSQAFAKVSEATPDEILMTSFSILFARQKADLCEMVRGLLRIKQLLPGEKVLIAEGCTHHRQSDDIGLLKIPQWIRQIAGNEIFFEWESGGHYPSDLSAYAVVVHCGGCMLNQKEMRYRINQAREQGVGITNYGLLIAFALGILPRALLPFPEAKRVFDEIKEAGILQIE